jgi:MerR family transcriptional regulator, copper efflux regulator
MVVPHTIGEPGGAEPVACTLTSAGLTAQADAWKLLIAGAMTEYTQTADGLRMTFRPEPGVEEELRRLVAVERECCSWAAWVVETDAGAPVLDVRSAGEGIAALHGMFRRG